MADIISSNAQLLKDILEEVSDGIVLTNEQGEIREWNQAMEFITGFHREDVLGKFIWDIQYQIAPSESKTPKLYENIKNLTQRLLAGDETSRLDRTIENQIQLRNGTLRTLQSSIIRVKTGQGYMLGSVIHDISGYKEATNQLNLQSTALESASHGIAVTDVQGRILWIDPAFTRLTGYSTEEALGNTFRILKSGRQGPHFVVVPPNRIQEMQEILGAIRRGERVEHLETERIRKDGQRIYVSLSISPIQVLQTLFKRQYAERPPHPGNLSVGETLFSHGLRAPHRLRAYHRGLVDRTRYPDHRK